MKLSEIKTDNSADVLCELVPLVESLALDETVQREIVNMFEKAEETSVGDIVKFAATTAVKLIPDLLKNKRKEIYKILAILNDKKPEEIAEQKFLETVKQIKEAVKDEELISLFK